MIPALNEDTELDCFLATPEQNLDAVKAPRTHIERVGLAETELMACMM